MNRPQVVSSAAGPLVVSEANPRYFTIRSDNAADRQVIYLTGSHINNNFHDGMGPGSDCPETPEKFDNSAYLKFLKDHGHNFIRLWRWEQFRSQAGGGTFHLCMTPQPFRTFTQPLKLDKSLGGSYGRVGIIARKAVSRRPRCAN